MACGCAKKKIAVQAPAAPQAQAAQIDGDMVLAELIDPNRGEHRVVGQAVFAEAVAPQMMIPVADGFSFDYRRHSAGEVFLVHRADIALQPHLFRPLPPPPAPDTMAAEVAKQIQEQEQAKPAEPEPKAFDLQSLPGVTKAIAALFAERGIDTPDCILEMGEEGLLPLEGMTEKRARTILAGAKKAKEKLSK